MQAVIISFDSLAANSLGCYGNDWIETPHWDRFASTGAVFDRHFADTPGPLAGMAWVNGRHALSVQGHGVPTSLGRRLKSNGVVTKLITAVEIQDWQRRAEFDNTQTVAGRDGFDVQPDEVSFAQVVKAGLSAWNESSFRECPRLLWLHSPGPNRAPQGFDSLYFEDFEERGERIAELTDEARSQHPAVYAGAVSLLDHWLGELLTGIEQNVEPTLVVIMAAQGHLWHRISPSRLSAPRSHRASLNDQLVRTPLTLKVIGDNRFKDTGSLRSDRLVQTIDLVPTLLDWFNITSEPNDESPVGQSWLRELTEDAPARAFLWIGGNGSADAIRSADWLCVRDRHLESTTDPTASAAPDFVSLFAKPEDIWDVDDIASQQPEIVSELLSHIPRGR